MEEDSKLGAVVKGGLGAIGLGAVASGILLPKPLGIYVAIAIILLALLLFGGYFLWRRQRARREREQFTSAIETQTSAAPKEISDPNKRAALDRVRQKFQTGLQEFRSRGKDIYQLPWFVIIGESGSGKTEAIRHSGIDFPPGLQDELQGSGGTVNMDWWFTNRGIVLDTAGSMLFNELRAGESGEWREFLRLLKRARPRCPVNGLFLVLSVESLIRDDSDTISRKASRLAQQLDIIQRVLDVRFPVYLLVTKCDLLTGFREFFDSIDDPLLQHQMFGWSNPEPLDSHFRADLVEQHLRTVAARLRRRRMALIRDTSGTGRLGDTSHFFAANYQLGKGPAPTRRLDEVDSLFALPESVMRLAPRLQRYLETIFVAGEWSAKPVFLRGIYFTSSMREGKALDEAIALATGLPLDQLPEERSWEKNRAFFLRDLFHEKVFRESGLVTRATNTLKMLRRNQLIIFGSAGAALLLLLIVAGLANHKLKQSVRTEAAYWNTGAEHLKNGIWSPSIVGDAPVDGLRYAYGGSNTIAVGGAQPTLIQFNQLLSRVAATNFPVPFIFKPMVWMGLSQVRNRPAAQREIFEMSVLRPLVLKTQAKMRTTEPSAASLGHHRDALLALMELQADGLGAKRGAGAFSSPAAPGKYLSSFLDYLTETGTPADPALTAVFEHTYQASKAAWPSKVLTNDNPTAILMGLENFNKASLTAQTNIDLNLGQVNDFADKLQIYQRLERDWLTSASDPCVMLSQNLVPAKSEVDASWLRLQSNTNFPAAQLTSLAARYASLAANKSNASASVLLAPLREIAVRLPPSQQGQGLFKQIQDRITALGSGAAENVLAAYSLRQSSIVSLDPFYLSPLTNSATPAFQARWALYTNACALAAGSLRPDENILGDQWAQYARLKQTAAQFRTTLTAYNGPFREPVSNVCDRIAHAAEETLQTKYLDDYVQVALAKLHSLAVPGPQDTAGLTNASAWLARIDRDLVACPTQVSQPAKLDPVRTAKESTRHDILAAFQANLRASARFPLTADATTAPMTVDELASVRTRLHGVSAALQDPVWQADRSGAVDQVKGYCGNAAAVVNALIKDDGTAAHWDVYFVPPPDGAPPEDKEIITAFRVAAASASQKINDLSQALATDPKSCFLCTLPVNAGLTISFAKLEGDPEKPWQRTAEWALCRLIRTGQAQRSEDGTRWTFKVSSPDAGIKGKVTFEARLDPKQPPLPKLELWPQ